MTYKDAARNALAVQDACNLSGVLYTFVDAVSAIRDHGTALGEGTEYINAHPIVTLFLDKLADLNRNASIHDAWSQVTRIAEETDAP